MNEKVKQAFQTIKDKVEDYVGVHFCKNELNIIENALNQAEDYKIQNNLLKEHEKELIAEQHRLFDLAKKQEEALKIIVEKRVNIIVLKRCKSVENYNADCNIQYDITRELTIIEFNLVKRVVENL